MLLNTAFGRAWLLVVTATFGCQGTVTSEQPGGSSSGADANSAVPADATATAGPDSATQPQPDATAETQPDAAPAPPPDAMPPQPPDATPLPQPDAMPPSGDFCEQSGTIAMEAEHYSAQVGFAQVSRGDASGGTAMQVGDSGSLDFQVFFASGGEYYLWLRTLAPDSESNGLYVQVDGQLIQAPPGHPYAGSINIFLWKSPTQWFWEPEWQGPGSGQVQGPVTFSVAAGEHKFSILKRVLERPLIDKIVLTTTNSPPSGLGPSDTPCP